MFFFLMSRRSREFRLALRNTPGMTKEEYRRRAYVYHREPAAPGVRFIPAGMEVFHENDVPVTVEGMAPPAPDYIMEGPSSLKHPTSTDTAVAAQFYDAPDPAVESTQSDADAIDESFFTPLSSPLSAENLAELAAIIADMEENLLEDRVCSQADMTVEDGGWEAAFNIPSPSPSKEDTLLEDPEESV